MKRKIVPGIALDRSEEGYEFFAQCLDEMLFEYTLDSFKPPSHNASTLVSEVLDVIDDIEEELIEKTNLAHLLEELRSIISSDRLAKDLISLDYERILNECTADHLAQTKARISLLGTALNAKRYMDGCVTLLSSLTEKGLEKDRIRQTTRCWMASLLRAGYTRRYTNERLTYCFFSKAFEAERCSKRLEAFFASFSMTSQKYEVTFSGSPLFKTFSEGCSKLGLNVAKVPPADIVGSDLEKLAVHSSGRVYLTLPSVEAVDPYAARKHGEEVIDIITNIFSIFHHTTLPVWSEQASVKAHGQVSAI